MMISLTGLQRKEEKESAKNNSFYSSNTPKDLSHLNFALVYGYRNCVENGM
jgi:hypothetical protein